MSDMGSLLPPRSERLGTLEMGDTLWYYNGPLVFTAFDEFGHTYLASAIEDDEIGARFLYAPISDIRLKRVRTGSISLRDAFQRAEFDSGFIVTVPRNSDSETTIDFVRLGELPDAYFAEPGVYLDDDPVDVPRATPDATG